MIAVVQIMKLQNVKLQEPAFNNIFKVGTEYLMSTCEMLGLKRSSRIKARTNLAVERAG